MALAASHDRAPAGRWMVVPPLLAIAPLLAWSTWICRHHVLDDTYIHLRYAWNLSQRGEFSFNPGIPSFGTSSMPYPILLSALGASLPLELWPALAKGLSLAAHLGAIALGLHAALRLARRSPAAGLLPLSLVVMLALPAWRAGFRTAWRPR